MGNPNKAQDMQKTTQDADELEKWEKKEWERYGYPVEDDECERPSSDA